MKEQTSVWCIGGMLVSLLLIQSAALAQIGPSRAQPISSTRAASEDMTTIINVTGTIVSAPPCKINNDVNLDYDFGDVIIQSVKDGIYSKENEIVINCQTDLFPNINLTINGAGKENTLDTNIIGLGVALFNSDDGKAVNLGEKLSLPLPSGGGDTLFRLNAVVVNPDDTALKTGDFKTTATLTTSYD